VGQTGANVNLSLQYFGSTTEPHAATGINLQIPAEVERDPNLSGQCGTTISANCIIRVRLKPISPGPKSGPFSISYSTNGSARTSNSVTLTGTGLTGASLSAAPPSLNFPQTVIGLTSELDVVISNASGAAQASSIVASTSAPFSIGTPSGAGPEACGSALNAGSSCRVRVRYTPTVLQSNASGVLTLNYSSGAVAGTPLTVALSGSSQAQAVLSLESQNPAANSPARFVALGNSLDLVYVIRNNGSGPAQLGSWNATQVPEAFSLQNGAPTTCTSGASIAANGTCQITYRFTPDRPNVIRGTLSIPYSGGPAGAVLTLPNSAIVGYGLVDRKVAAGGNRTCVIDRFGQLRCFGRNTNNELGVPGLPAEISAAQLQSLAPVNLGSNVWVKQVSLGFSHSCAILDDDSVKCWGRNEAGQLGYNDQVDRGGQASQMGDNLARVDLGTNRKAKSLALGYSHTCAILDDDSMKCWGDNSRGQLGIGSTVNQSRAPLMGVDFGGRKVLSAFAGVAHTCARLDDSSLRCFGDNFRGQLGLFMNPGEFFIPSPTQAVSLGTGLTALGQNVGSSSGVSCALVAGGRIKCWGANQSGSLGTCWALNSSGVAGSCWSPGFTGPTDAYGNRANEMGQNLPFVDLGTWNAVGISSGNNFSCSVSLSGQVKCWGENDKGQLGLGNTTSRGLTQNTMGANLPNVNLGALSSSVRHLALGEDHACALLSDSAQTVKCWGSNQYRQLGHSVADPNGSGNRGDGPNEMGDGLPGVSITGLQ
jgi:alpha-tubulin suppressor-like RCC1 family protein